LGSTSALFHVGAHSLGNKLAISEVFKRANVLNWGIMRIVKFDQYSTAHRFIYCSCRMTKSFSPINSPFCVWFPKFLWGVTCRKIGIRWLCYYHFVSFSPICHIK